MFPSPSLHGNLSPWRWQPWGKAWVSWDPRQVPACPGDGAVTTNPGRCVVAPGTEQSAPTPVVTLGLSTLCPVSLHSCHPPVVPRTKLLSQFQIPDCVGGLGPPCPRRICKGPLTHQVMSTGSTTGTWTSRPRSILTLCKTLATSAKPWPTVWGPPGWPGRGPPGQGVGWRHWKCSGVAASRSACWDHGTFWSCTDHTADPGHT